MAAILRSILSNTMAAMLKLFILLVLQLTISCNSEPFPINVWPIPTSISWPSPKAATISPAFQISAPYAHKHLRTAVKRHESLLFSEGYKPIVPPSLPISPTPLLSLTLHITDILAPLHHGVDESYSLTISSSNGVANLSSATVWGAIHGLESFSQLSWGSPPLIATDLYIKDRPLFPHRGLMLDTSRNFYPVEDIMRTIATMGANKLNVFHWHITDSHSFPLVLPSEPNLAAAGSYGPDMQYSPEDVKKIVDFAMSYGVRVVPEFDTPGHSLSWAGAYPEIVTCANQFWLPNGPDDWAHRLASEPGPGQLNPLHPRTYEVLHNVFRDSASLFPDPFFHSGADELNPLCWSSDPSIQSFLSSGHNLSQLLQRFISDTHPFLVSLNRTVVYWEDILLDSTIHVPSSLIPPSTTILQTWNNGINNIKDLVTAGYRVIVSSADFYYLDCGHGSFLGNYSAYDAISEQTSWCGPFKTWERIYDYDIVEGLKEKEKGLVIGGEVALWSEQADGTVLDGRVWPRAAALAEAMWSGNRDENGRRRTAMATDRLMDWRHRMVGRGVRAEPIQPLWCRRNPGMCNFNA
ncbi:hexosaminidase protein [Dioscorea alata]|uniref:Hexosaminidase protein n=2 Tax=Dioscorea alata TaxID=55571 RepID=A0ACB7UMQ4_DIOAL|nr:hexosaminidase protein [Dioscorea alata]KAH7661819.1 hexosaminidase protein [Dioscorea alata]